VPERIYIEERAIPRPGPGEVLVRVHCVAICGSDQDRFWGRERSTSGAVVMGHEFSGRVAALGVGVTGPAVGQWATVAPLLNCGECALCLRGRPNLCAQRRAFGRDVDGALQDYAAVRADRVYPLPPNVSPGEGALVEPLAVACHAVRRAGIEPQGNTLVLGAGAIGLLIAQVWRTLGGGPVAVVDLDESRLGMAAELSILRWTGTPGGPSIDTLFEATGSPEAFADWLPALAPGGQAVVVGKLKQPVAMEWVSLLRKEIEITTSRYFTLADFEQAMQLLRVGQVRVSPLIGRTVPFRRLGERAGRTVMAEARQVIRLLVELHEE
jgi:L-iditol 2-dehydrogenase